MKFNVRFSEQSMRMNVQMNQSPSRFNAQFANLQKVTELKDADPYMGDYEITPKVDAQTMPTAQKLMTQDVTIKAIPYFNVSNNSGGSTVYIAKEV